MTEAPQETFLQKQLRLKREREAATRPAPTSPITAYTGPRDDLWQRRAAGWCQVALEHTAADIAKMAPDTGRNSEYSRQLWRFLRYAHAGHLDTNHVLTTMKDAALRCGLRTDEIDATERSAQRQAHTDGPTDPELVDNIIGAPITPFSDVSPHDLNEGETDAAPDRSTWWPKDLTNILNGDDDGEPPPAYLTRNDGHNLLYAGKINALIGESESGKSWIALAATAQTLSAGGRATYLDFEDTAPGVIDRLRQLGVTTEQLGRLAYISPLDAYTVQAQGDLAQHLAAHAPQLIAFDGINAAMTLLGLNLLDNMDYTTFSLTVLRPLARTGAAVVTVDHVTKSKEGRGDYAIGAQAKRADIDGCALMVEVERKFGRGQTGRLKLTVSKDRPGHVRAVSASGKNAGTVVLVSTGQTITATIEAPDLRPAEERKPFRPTHLMQKVSEYLEQVGEVGASKANVEKEIVGKREAIRIALDTLTREGYAASRIEKGGAIISTSTRAYREADDTPRPPRPNLAPTSPQGEAAHAQQTSPPRPPVYTGARGEVNELAPDDPTNNTDDDREEWWKR